MLIAKSKTIPFLFIILFCIIVAELLIMSLVLQGLPNNIQFTAANNFSFYLDLFSANASAAIKLALIDNPVFVVQQLGDVNHNEIWSVYFMPVHIVLFTVISFLIIHALHLKFNASKWSQLGIASTLLLFSIMYVRVQACCTAGPRWVLDIWLISQISDPQLDHIFWQTLYTHLAEHFTLIQFLLSTTALIILYLISYTNLLSRNTISSV